MAKASNGRLKVIVPLTFDDEELRQIGWALTDSGKRRATRQMVRDWVFSVVSNAFMGLADRQDEEERGQL